MLGPGTYRIGRDVAVDVSTGGDCSPTSGEVVLSELVLAHGQVVHAAMSLRAVHDGSPDRDPCHGAVEHVEVRVNSLRPLLAPVHDGTLEGPPDRVGQAGPGRVWELRNDGDRPLRTGTLGVRGDGAGDVQVLEDRCSHRTLLPMTSCTVTVSVRATTAGFRSPVVSLTDNSPRGERQVVVVVNAS